MATDDPPYLTVGTDVSAKYKGAFCEAKIKKANRVVKCKVAFKNGLGTHMVTDDQIKGPLRLGSEVEAKHPEKNQMLEAVINKMQDYSQYTVVFDDGDETTLRRTSLCLKSGRHFAESPTLDQFPLTNPEHFSTPVIGSSKFKRKRRSTMNSSLDFESSDDESVQRRVQAIRDKEHNPDLGRVVCVDFGDRRKKDNWYPGLIVPASTPGKVNKDEHLVRSFKDGKYYQVPKRDIRDFVRDSIPKVDNNALKTAIEKAFNYLDKDELPPHWDKALFACLDMQSADEDSGDSNSDTSDDKPSEFKDRFVAELYKFMDDRGTPINKAPTVCNTDLNLYKLYKIVSNLGGYNKVTNKNKWKVVYARMALPGSNQSGPNQIKIAYKRFLQSYEDLYRKLGCTMLSNIRSTRGRHRSDRNIIVTRTRDRDSPKGRKNSKEPKEKAPSEKKAEEKPKSPEKKDTETSAKSEEKQPKTPEKKRVEKSVSRSVEKEPKKPEEKPRLVRSQSITKEKKDSPKAAKEKEVAEKARTREDARKEKNESPEKKGTRSASKAEPTPKKEEPKKEKTTPKEKETTKKEEPKSEVDTKPKAGGPKKEEKKPAKEKKPEKKEKKEEKSPSAKEGKSTPRRGEEKSPKRKVKREERLQDTPKRSAEEGSKPKLRKEEASDDEMASQSVEDGEDVKETSSQEEVEKKPPPPGKGKAEDEEPPNKGKRRALKMDDKDEKESLCDMSDSDDESLPTDSEKPDVGREVEIGDRVKVKYGRGRLQKVYEAKVLKIEPDGTERRYYVHYAGWNTRYDEWVKKSYIVANISGKQKDNTKSSSPNIVKKVDRGRPPGVLANTRKNSTGSLRSTRSEKKSPAPSSRESRARPGKETRKDPDGTSDEEELFSDDEPDEKEKPDLAEIEKAICVDESQDAVVKEEPKAEEPEPVAAPPVPEENSSVPPVPEPSVKTEVEAPKDSSEVEEEDKSSIKEVPPADLSLTSSNSPSESASSAGKLPPAEENKSALSFAGLIKKEPSPKPLHPESAFMSLMEGDKVSFESNKSFQSSPPIFDDDMNSPQNSESASTTSKEKFDPKSISNLFDSILKQPSDNESNDVSKSSITEVVSKVPEENEKGDLNASCSENLYSFESSKNADLSKEASKAGDSPPLKIADVVTTDSCKSKDNFDMLLQQSNSFGPETCKESDSKDDIFSFTFSPHNASKDNMASDQPFDNQPLKDSLYPKQTETVDVSKMIPGILERLKKDVVADVSDSPPPPKEELNFDFLRGTQSVSKCLSRSDSSNSLRICESDTNDSNIETKDSLVSDRVEVSLDASISHDDKSSCPALPVTALSSNTEPQIEANDDESSINKEEDSIVESQKAADSISEPAVHSPEPEVPVAPEPLVSEPDVTPATEESSTSEKEKEQEPLQEAPCPVEVPSALESPSLDDLSTAASMSLELPPIKVPTQEEDEKEVPEKVPEEVKGKEETPVVAEQAKSPEPNIGSVIAPIISSDAVPVKEEPVKEEPPTEVKVEDPSEEQSDQDATQVTEEESPVARTESAAAAEPEEEMPSSSGKKELKKKKLSKKVGKKLLGEDREAKDSKIKSKKRLKMEGGADWDGRTKSSDLKSKSKKLKKSKNKKRFLRHEDGEKKSEDSEQLDKMKRREKKKSDKKFLKGSGKGDEEQLGKKKKNKKNRGDKKDLFDKKTKKKRKLHLDEDTDSDRESVCKKRKRKKFQQQKAKEENSSSEEEGREKLEPDMAFLLCEEKVLASDLAEEEDSSSSEGGPAERTVLDNTPPTTPSSTESSSPPHPFAVEGFGGGGRASEEYNAAATLAFAVGKSPVVAAPSSAVKRSKGPDTPAGKRKKRMPRFVPEQAGKSPKHKTTYPRAAKVDNYCEDSSGTSCSPPYNSMTSPRPAPYSRLSADIRNSCFIPLQEKDPEKRIAYLQEKMAALRKKYMALRAEVVAIDHKRRRARKKVKEAAGISANSSMLSEDGPSCS